MPQKTAASSPRLFIGLGLLGFFAVACASAPPPVVAPVPPPPPQCNAFETIDLELSPATRLNPDREGYSRSVVVRVYQLEGTDAFQQASFEELWHDPSGGSTARTVVAGPDELVLIPGKPDKRALKRNPKATHVGVAAKFREHQGLMGWKAVAALTPANPCPNPVDPTSARVGIDFVSYAVRLR